MGRRSWIVKIKNCKKDIKKCIIIGLENDNVVCGIIKYKNAHHILFMGDGNDSCRGFTNAGYSVLLLDNVDNKSGKIVGAKYMTETNTIDCVMNYDEIDKIVTKWYNDNKTNKSDVSDKSDASDNSNSSNNETLENRVNALHERIKSIYKESGNKLKDIENPETNDISTRLDQMEKYMSKLEDKTNT